MLVWLQKWKADTKITTCSFLMGIKTTRYKMHIIDIPGNLSLHLEWYMNKMIPYTAVSTSLCTTHKPHLT